MARQRPLGVKIFGILFILGGIFSLIGQVFYIINGSGDAKVSRVEMYRQQYFQRFPATEENIKRFEEIVPQLEKAEQTEKEILAHPVMKTQRWWQLFSGLVSLGLGIGLLMLKEKARIGVIGFQLIGTAMGFIYMYVGYSIAFKGVLDNSAAAGINNFIQFLPLIIGTVLVLSSTFLVIWYFNRPQVKDKFA